MNTQKPSLTIVGAGPVGCVLATLLANRGHSVELFEKRPDMRRAQIGGGRSINLVLTNRGLSALERVGLREQVLELTVPVLGRMMHDLHGELTYQPYGKDDSECNYSVSRGMLNEFLLTAAEEAGVAIEFNAAVEDVDFDRRRLIFEEGRRSAEFDVLIGTDGAPSVVRKALVEKKGLEESVDFMDWGYKELLFPSGPDDSYLLEKNALHIWPRGSHFLMALANLDGSFTGTVYMPQTGPDSFESIDDQESLLAFFERHYGDATPLLGDFVDTFFEHPVGTLGTVRSAPWYWEDKVLLVGDAAHGIVPFFGQGLNSGFEDCLVLDDLLAQHEDFAQVFPRFFNARKPNTEAIADMALENAREMGEKVANPTFLLKKKVESLLEKHLGDIYRSRYAMVMYSHIPYAAAYAVGKRQKEILATLAEGLDRAQDVDLERARQLIEEKLVPLYDELDLNLEF